MHGFSQKIGDSYAGAAKAEGMTPLEFAKRAVKDTISQLYANEWRAPSVAGLKVSDLAVALSRLLGKTIEECHAFVEGLSEEDEKAWKKKGKVAGMLTVIRAEKAVAAAKRAQEKASKVTEADTTVTEEDKDELDMGTEEETTGETTTA